MFRGMKMRISRFTVAALLLAAVACSLPPREQIRVVGSSTVYPFIATAAEQFGRATEHATPIVESTGTGGGLKLFCAGIGEKFPDIANASRAIKPKERELCAENGVTSIREIPIGFDGIVIARAKGEAELNLSRKQLFTALAKQLPRNDGSGLQPNPYTHWNEISPELPSIPIRVYGPPPTSGTRDAFVELVMEIACEAEPAFVAAYPDKEHRKRQCHQLREDGHFIDAGENDNIIVQKLRSNPNALGIFGYSFLEQQRDVVQGMRIEAVKPDFAEIAKGRYTISRSLYVYVKEQHYTVIPGLEAFVHEIISPQASGAEGYMTLKGLIPLPPKAKVEGQLSE